jgi:hypothetical protein
MTAKGHVDLASFIKLLGKGRDKAPRFRESLLTIYDNSSGYACQEGLDLPSNAALRLLSSFLIRQNGNAEAPPQLSYPAVSTTIPRGRVTQQTFCCR